MERQTLNSLNGGPSGGKTTLYSQAIRAHLFHESFFIPGFTFPSGRVAIVQSDRSVVQYNRTFEPLGIANHPEIELLNFVDDRILNQSTRSAPKSSGDLYQLDQLREKISQRLQNKGIGTLILDLYDDYHIGGPNTRKAAYDGRLNLQWAQDLNVAILAIMYPFKQTTMKKALRLQDRQSGVLHLQASMDWKFTLVDAEESGTPYGLVAAQPPSGSGMCVITPVIRGTEAEGDKLGLFRPYIGATIPSITEIMTQYKCGQTKAYAIQKQLETGADPEFVN